MATFREVEAAFEVDVTAVLPDLCQVPGVAAVRRDEPIELVARYVDTSGRDLLRAGITLRRRVGGSDDGWHLKVPTEAPDGRDLAHAGTRDRTEHRAPVGSSQPPAELVDLVRARVHGVPLVPLAMIRTRRTVHHLLDPDGREVLEVVEDQVRGEPAHGDATTWWEWEAELRDGDGEQLAAVLELLATAGRSTPRAAGKLVRTLGEVATVVLTVRDGSAGEAARAVLAAGTERLFGLDPALRAGDDDAVHEARIATRRLRAVLSVCRPVFDDRAGPPAEALRELGRLLGAVRDPAVESAAYRARAAAEPAGDRTRAVLRLLVADRTAARRRGLRALRTYLDGPAYAQLCAALTELSDAAPAGPQASAPAQHLLRRRTRSRYRTMRQALRAASSSPPSGGERDAALHEARKRARHARYAAEVAATVLGDRARRSVVRFQAVQDTLGDQHDTVVRRATLERLAARPGADAFVLGRWHALEQVAGEQAERAGERAARRATAHGHRRWMA